jgi:hypothetical protein
MKIKKNTPCFISTIGHNNFWYPVFTEAGMTYITEDIESPDFKAWTCGNQDLKALLVPTNSIKDIYGDSDGVIVVWVHNRNLKNP